MNILPYLGIIVCIMFSAFFSGSEIAFNAANKLRLKKNAESGKKTAKVAYDIKEKFTNALSSILIGNNLVNIASSSIATIIMLSIVGSDASEETKALGATVTTIVMTVIILIFGEIMPKILAKENADTIVHFIAYPIKILSIILAPVNFVVLLIVKLFSFLWKSKKEDEPTVTEEELSTIIETAEQESVIDEDQSELLQSALEFPKITVEEIITHRTEMLAIDIDDDMDSIIDIATNSNFSRIPVYEDSIDNVIGILYLKHFFKELIDTKDVDIRSLLIEPYFVNKTMRISNALAEMRERQHHIAIVVDEYGGTMGIVTMEDILEQLVGDIWDETDEIVEDYVSTGTNTYDINGEMNVYDMFELLEVSDRDFESDYMTVGGWAVEMLDSDPHEGDVFEYKNIRVTVIEMDELRVASVAVTVTPVEEEEEE